MLVVAVILVVLAVGLAIGARYLRSQQIGRERPSIRLLTSDDQLSMLYGRIRTAMQRATAAGRETGSPSLLDNAIADLHVVGMNLADCVVRLSASSRTASAVHQCVSDVQALERVSHEIAETASTLPLNRPHTASAELAALAERVQLTRTALTELEHS